jgi:hypothetical protein
MNATKRPRFIYAGNVQDIKSSLIHAESNVTIQELENEIESEIQYKNRKSVVDLLRAAVRRKQKSILK